MKHICLILPFVIQLASSAMTSLPCNRTITVKKDELAKMVSTDDFIRHSRHSCFLRLKAATATRRVIIKFEPTYNPACGRDYVEVLDGPYMDSPLLGRYCGHARRAPTFTASGQNILVIFKRNETAVISTKSSSNNNDFEVSFNYYLKTPFTCTAGSRTKKKSVKCDGENCSVYCNMERYFPQNVTLTNVSCSDPDWKRSAQNMCVHRRRILKHFRNKTVCPTLTDIYIRLLEPEPHKCAEDPTCFTPDKKIFKCSKICERYLGKANGKFRYPCREFDGACKWRCVKERYINRKCSSVGKFLKRST